MGVEELTKAKAFSLFRATKSLPIIEEEEEESGEQCYKVAMQCVPGT